jgi:hypothetical protein
MKPPQWFRELLAAEGTKILKEESTFDEAAAELAQQIIDNRDDDPPFLHRLAADCARRQAVKWIRTHELPGASGGGGQGDMFPDLPRNLETSPGRFAAQAVMTGRDWDAALRQAQTKASNAAGFADGVQRAYDKVRPLLTTDELTTADVLRPSGFAQASGAI